MERRCSLSAEHLVNPMPHRWARRALTLAPILALPFGERQSLPHSEAPSGDSAHDDKSGGTTRRSAILMNLRSFILPVTATVLVPWVVLGGRPTFDEHEPVAP